LIAIIYGMLRTFEIFVYQINVLLFDEYRIKKAKKDYALRGYRRIAILLLHNYFEIIFWFALVYRNLEWAFGANEYNINSLFASINFSFFVMTTFGHTFISPKTIYGEIAIFLQSIMGLFMAILIFARFVSLLPTPSTLDEFEK